MVEEVVEVQHQQPHWVCRSCSCLVLLVLPVVLGVVVEVVVAASEDGLEGGEVSVSITLVTRQHTRRARNHKILKYLL